jgi:hypothetical protein
MAFGVKFATTLLFGVGAVIAIARFADSPSALLESLQSRSLSALPMVDGSVVLALLYWIFRGGDLVALSFFSACLLIWVYLLLPGTRVPSRSVRLTLLGTAVGCIMSFVIYLVSIAVLSGGRVLRVASDSGQVFVEIQSEIFWGSFPFVLCVISAPVLLLLVSMLGKKHPEAMMQRGMSPVQSGA